MSYTINDFAMMVPMRYYNNEDANNVKRKDMINNKDGEYIASEKKDGDWSMLIHHSKGHNLIRSRSLSKVTGVYGDYTAKVPHICEAMDLLPDNTVLLAELCWDEHGTNANTVGTILRCLPAKAVERQKDNKLKAVVFDMLMFDGQDLTVKGYKERVGLIIALLKSDYRLPMLNFVLEDNPLLMHPYLYPTDFYEEGDFAEIADRVIASGGEGLVIQRNDCLYMPGTRTAWKTLKLKQSLPEMELKVVDTLEPKKFYEGDCPETWEYKLYDIHNDAEYLVTKPYYFGWKNGIRVEYNNTTTDITSGLTDDDRAWLATDEAKEKIANGELYAVVRAMQENDLGRLRHAYLVRLRTDM